MLTLSLVAVLVQSASTDSTRRAAYQAYLDFADLVQGGRVNPGWLPDGTSFWFAEGGPQDRSLVKIGAGGLKEALFDVARLRVALTEKLGHEPAGRGVPFEQVSFVAPTRVRFGLEGKSWELDLESYRLSRLPEPTAFDFTPLLPSERARITPGTFIKESFTGLGPSMVPESLSPDGKWFVSMKDDNLVLRATVDGRATMLTTDGKPEQYWAVETVKWNPWSPDGQRLAVFKVDTRGMARIPTIQWLKPLEEVIEVITIPVGPDGRTDLDRLGSALAAGGGRQVAAVALQNPNFFGCVEPLAAAASLVHGSGALFEVVVNEPVSMGLLHGPGHFGADVALGEAQGLGTPLQFGGPFLGFMATKEALLRQLPGRLVGEAVDEQGRRGYVLTLSTREQHIRREKATSNICTNQGLIATAATIYMSLMGPAGMREVASQCHSKALWAKQKLSGLQGCRARFSAPIFNEFVLDLPADPEKINRELLRRGILGGLPLGRHYPAVASMSNSMLFCVTEMNRRDEIEKLAGALGEVLP